jgi:hypothetical protein
MRLPYRSEERKSRAARQILDFYEQRMKVRRKDARGSEIATGA